MTHPKKFHRHLSPFGRCLQATGSFYPAAQLLHQLEYRFLVRDTLKPAEGHVWVIQTAENWCEELGYSLNQHKDAVSRLKSLGLVEVRALHFNGNKMLSKISHMRLLYKPAKAGGPPDSVVINGANDPPQKVANNPAPVASNNTFHVVPFNPSKEIKTQANACVAEEKEKGNNPWPQSGEEDSLNEESGQGEQGGKQVENGGNKITLPASNFPPSFPPSPPTPSALVNTWLVELTKLGVPFTATQADLGQMKTGTCQRF